MEAILVQKANAAPNATAVVDGDRSVSYRELIARADVLADLLDQQSLEPENPVCILADAGLPQILAQVAVLRAGGSCVPIDPAVPADRLKGMLEDLDTTHLIADKDHAHRAAHLSAIHVEMALEAHITLDTDAEIALRAGRSDSHRSHIVFTSGSTGRPKPIQVLSSSILHAIKNFPTGSLHPSDRMTALITPGFDLSICEMWEALLAGATIVRVPDLVRADPLALQSFVHEHKITVMIVPTALFHVIALTAPATFGGLRHVIVGGEAVSSNAMRKVLETSPPKNLWNGYGPAEATIYVTMIRVDEDEVQRPRIGIGRSVGDTRIYLLDDNLKPIVEPGHTGEICIAGPQVSPGYLNRPEENEKSFIHIDAPTLGVSSDQPVRLYRTGDLAQWRDNSGLLDYIGRADDQVKISGYRVELGDIACCIEKHPQVHSCVVNYVQKGDVDCLEAYVIPADWDSHFPSDELIDWVKQRLPSYMVPRMVYKKRSFPLSANGKVDRRALQPDKDEQPCDGEEGRHPQKDTTEDTVMVNGGNGMEDLVDWLASTLQEYLPESEITPTDNIFSHGLSSLHAARLIGRIRQDRGKSITLAQLHQNPTIDGLAKFLSSSDDKTTDLPSLERCVRDSKHVDTDLLPPDWQAENEGRVFLTGATGFLGAHILHQLLAIPSVQKVACLARGRGNLSASARIQQTLEKFDLWDGRLETTRKIVVLEGDLGDTTLGLGEDQFKWLIDWASVIFHVGARVNWCEPYEAHYVPNVVGTRNIIRAAMLGRRKALHYVSSIDVWTVTGFINKVDRVYEDEPLMPHVNAVPYDTGYSASQFVAEEIVQRARACGLPTAIYRPGFIIGHSEKGIANENDFFSRLIMGSIQSGYFPHLPTQRLEYVTVDYVTAAILHIASSWENLGRAYHIVPPDRSVSVDYDQKYRMLREIGYPVQMIDYKEWVGYIRDSPENALESMMPLLDEAVYEDLSRLQTSRNTPVYDPTNTARALQDRPDIKYVALDANLLQKFIHNWVKRGQYRLDLPCKGCSDGEPM
ncbi:putative NRPS-like protein biosynthetic cluster [Aspergillus udagawae]|uniref:NRPS-like protein biosynthetic cluster n=1 Tax=Aspergillus udagawae TaxID=91492 RepID=A0A8E0V3Y1_9EURO|nr:putative NRPS-like protein biosynthetic cluster [Aspergillus udagawae]GIC92860.1 putative NRPS-like protein biosynthetic cluster [Aspergillus udagawae]